MAEQPKDPRTASGRIKPVSPELLKNLPLKQRLPLQYASKLETLKENYRHVYIKFEEPGIVTDLTDVLSKTGFLPHPQGEQKIKVLIHNIVKWLDAGNLVLLHFRPKFSDFTIIHLLREIKLASPATRFEGLIPAFFGAVSSAKQMELFKHLGAFGIRYVFFLTQGAPPDRILEEVMEELAKFDTLVKGQSATSRLSAVDMEDVEAPPAAVVKYKGLLRQGEELMGQGKFEEAIARFSEAIEMGPNFDALMDRGEAYYKARKYLAALADFREAARLARNAPEPYAKVGECSLSLVREAAAAGDRAKADEWYRTAISHLQLAAEMVRKMEEDFAQAPERFPPIPFAPILAALASVDIRGMGLPAAEDELAGFARMVLEKCRMQEDKRSDVSVETRIEEALLRARYGDYEEAERIYRTVAESDPLSVAPAFNNFAVELRKNGQFGKAFEIYMELLKGEIPDRAIVVENARTAGFRYAVQLRERGKPGEAVKVYRSILDQQPREREWALCELAMTFRSMGESGSAATTLLEAIYINPKLSADPRFQPYRELLALRDEMLKKLEQSFSNGG